MKTSLIKLDWDIKKGQLKGAGKPHMKALHDYVTSYRNHDRIINVQMRSSPRKNLHVKILLASSLSYIEEIERRALLWDDPLRIKLDLVRLLNGEKDISLLWDYKIGNKKLRAGEWVTVYSNVYSNNRWHIDALNKL